MITVPWLAVLVSGLAVAVAVGLYRQRPSYVCQLRRLQARPSAHALADLARLALIAGLVADFFPPEPWERLIGAAVLGVLVGILANPRIAIALTGGPDSRLVLRRAWDSLEDLARRPQASSGEDDRLEIGRAILSRLPPPRDPREARLVELLKEQTPRWLAPAPEWSLDEVRTELRLYELACELWPNDAPKAPDAKLPKQLLWELFVAYETVVSASRVTDTPGDASRRALERLKTLRRPGVEAFIDLVTRLDGIRRGDEEASAGEAEQVASQIQAEMDALFTSPFVFRGAHDVPTSYP